MTGSHRCAPALELLAILIALLLFTSPCRALGRPDWAVPFLGKSTPAGPYIAPADRWVCLYSEVEFDLSDSGTILRRQRSIIENMSEKEETFMRMVEFDEGQEQLVSMSLTVQRSVLWHDINLEKKSAQASQAEGMKLIVTGAETIPPHHRVVWEYTLADKLGFLPWECPYFPENLPVAEKRICVASAAAAKGLTLRLLVPGGGAPPESFQKGADGSWTASAIPAAGRLPSDLVYQPDTYDIYPSVLVTFAGDDAASWTAFAEKYYAAWTQAMSKVDAKHLREYGDGLCKGLGSPLEKARRLATFVQEDVRYDDSNERAMSAWVPLAPEESLRSMKADCKGKVMLLLGLLGTQGIEAVPILLRSSSGYFAWGSHVATAHFNHVICALRLPSSEPALSATLVEAPLKGWVLFDPTASQYRLGESLPGYEGLPAFSVATGHTGVFTMHTASLSIEKIRVRIQARLKSNDDLDCELTISDNGGSPLMHSLLGSFSDEKNKSRLNEALSSGMSGRIALAPQVLTRASADPSGNASLKAGFLMQHARQELTQSSLVANPLAVAALVRGLPNGLPRREPPSERELIQLAPPWDARLNTSGPTYEIAASVTLSLPSAYELSPPAPRTEEHPWLRYACSWKKAGEDTWEGTLSLAVPRGAWSPADRKTRLQIVDDILRGLYAPLVLSKKG